MRWREPAIAFMALTGFALIVELGHLSLQVFQPGPWVSAAAFFGGRVWRSFVLPESPTGTRSIGAVFGMLLMAAAAAAGDAAEMLPNLITGRLIRPETALLLLILVGGILLGKSPRLALVTWAAIVLLALPWAYQTLSKFPAGISDAARVSICSAAFAVLGYQIVRRGEAAYARALRLLPPSDFYSDRDRDAAQTAGAGQRVAA